MYLRLDRTFSAPPELVWTFLTDPEWMNEWSTAEIQLTSPGDRQRPDGVGATRKVLVPMWQQNKSVLKEVIEISRPPETFVYRVIDSPPIRHHRGEITLTASGDKTHVSWQVEAEFMLPGLGTLMKRQLEQELNKSLDSLAEVLQRQSTRPVPIIPRYRPLKESQPLPELFEAAEQTLAEQRSLAAEMTAGDDPRRWFPVVYEYVTEEQIRRCREGLVQYPGWTLRLIPVFRDYFFGQNLVPWLKGHRGTVGKHWERAFFAMEGGGRREPKPDKALFIGLRHAIVAHIEEDLCRAIAEVYVRHYADQCDYVRYRADYLLMGDVFAVASARAMDQIPKDYIPLYGRILNRLLPSDITALLQNRNYYDIPRKRLATFERGQRIAETMLRVSENTA